MTLAEFDNEIRTRFPIIAGVDEAGRGPLAGDVYAAAVILPSDLIIEGINDSKKLSPKKRDKLYDEIIEKAEAFCIASASLAMKRAVEGLKRNVDIVLVDGNKAPDVAFKTCPVIKGDASSQSIAAASILAKVARDRYMLELDKQYLEYQFSKHKGYGTKLHYEMIKKYGISKVHRPSFLKNLNEK